MILQAPRLVPDASRCFDGGGLVVERGRILALLDGPGAVRRARRRHGGRSLDLGHGLLAPGFVNAHAHLELGALAGRVPAGRAFSDWIAGIVAARRGLDRAPMCRGVTEGARALLAGGTTCVGDIASDPASARASRSGLRSVVYRELLDAWHAERTDAALRRVARPLPERSTRTEGLSPHAPYTTSARLLRAVARLARRRRAPLTVHWAESEEEGAWLVHGTGPLSAVLGPAPRRRGLDLLEEAGLLGRTLSLVHGNHPARGEPGRLARAGTVLVHCPGTHAFFERAPFPWARYRRAGVDVAIGTDSLASNTALDMRRELRLARRAAPELDPALLFEMGTRHGARALGLGDSVGVLERGRRADLAWHDVELADGGDARSAITGLLEGRRPVLGVWVEGRRVRVGSDPQAAGHESRGRARG